MIKHFCDICDTKVIGIEQLRRLQLSTGEIGDGAHDVAFKPAVCDRCIESAFELFKAFVDSRGRLDCPGHSA